MDQKPVVKACIKIIKQALHKQYSSTESQQQLKDGIP